MAKDDSVNIHHPKFIGYWLLLGVLWLIVQLPQSWRMAIGSGLGRLLYKLFPYRRRIVEINIAKVFPEWSQQQRDALCVEFSKSLGKGAIETGMGWFLSDRRINKRVRYDIDAHSQVLLSDTTQPVILVSMHCTLLELGVRLLGMKVDSGGMYKPLRNPFFNEWIRRHRDKAATKLIAQNDMREVLTQLKDGTNIWYALDQDMGPRVSTFAPFFGIEAASVNILPKLKARTGAKWVPVFFWREEGDKSYVVKILPELVSQEGETDRDVMTRVNALFEHEIREHPDQYYWVHRRFKSHPDGREHDYPSRH